MVRSKLNCSAFEQVIEAYLDGELHTDDARAIESHVSECPVCAEELSLARQVSEGLTELTPLDCPDVVTARVTHTMSSLGDRANSVAEGSRPRWTASNQSIWKIAAAVALAVAGVILAISQSKNSQPIDSANVDDTYTPEEVALATRQLEWTLAYVEHVTRSSMQSVREDVIGKRVTPSIKSAVNFLLVLDRREESTIQ
jgi:predicted anti-sigma-YlaC factor YlaD